MYKVLLIMGMMVVWTAMHQIQLEQELSMRVLHAGKRAVDRAAHAAAQQVDAERLADGMLSLDKASAYRAAGEYLRGNLALDEAGNPLPGSLLRQSLEIVALDVISEDETFPYYYMNELADYEVWLDRPGVIIIARLFYDSALPFGNTLDWYVRGTAQLTL